MEFNNFLRMLLQDVQFLSWQALDTGTVNVSYYLPVYAVNYASYSCPLLLAYPFNLKNTPRPC
jgi:hypothetical protein